MSRRRWHGASTKSVASGNVKIKATSCMQRKDEKDYTMYFKPTSVEVYQLHDIESVRAKALELQNIGGFECEREFRDIRNQFIKDKIINNEMLVFNWAKAHVEEDDSVRRVNGQHSSEVFMGLTDEEAAHIKFPVWIAEATYACKTRVDRAYLFNQFDPKESARGLEDNIGVHTALHPDIKHIDRYAANKATQGILWYLQHIEGLSLKGARHQFGIVHRNGEVHPFLLFADLMLNKNRRTQELVGKPVVAAMYHTTRTGGEQSKDFWKKVATASILDPDSNYARLADFLDKARKTNFPWPKAARDKFSNHKKPNDKEIFQACLRIYHADHFGVPRIDPIDRLRDRTMSDMVERYRTDADGAAEAAD